MVQDTGNTCPHKNPEATISQVQATKHYLLMFPGSSGTAVEVDPKCSSWAYCPLQLSCCPTSWNWWQLSSLQLLCLLYFPERWTYLPTLPFSCYFKVNQPGPGYSPVWRAVPDSEQSVSMCPAPLGTDLPIPVFMDSQKFPGPHAQNSRGHLWELLKTANNSNSTAGPLWEKQPLRMRKQPV